MKKDQEMYYAETPKNPEQVKSILIDPKLKPEEELIGLFLATYWPSYWWLSLAAVTAPIGLCFWFFGIRNYYVAVTTQGMHFHKMRYGLGKRNTYSCFSWNEITKLKLGKGFMTASLKLKFSNGRKLKLKPTLRGYKKVAKLDDKTKEYLLSKMS